ncbi:purine nucleoside permease [Sparassis latifolia]
MKPQFGPEADIWYSNNEVYDVLARNISVPGLSPLYPDVHCTANAEVCQLTTGESEINAAVTISSLVASPLFHLTKTYFMIAGIAGINPHQGTIASVTFARYAVQVALQYEFDAREMPANFSTGYVGFGTTMPNQYPTTLYGTEVFEVNTALRDLAVGFARQATLNDSAQAVAYRATYAEAYTAAGAGPSVLTCDVTTSDVYFSGNLLGDAFANWTSVLTNGTGVYCMTAQEDNATLAALLRGTLSSFVDFARIIVMRTASDFDREAPGYPATYNLFWADAGAFEPSLQNIYLAGVEVVNGIIGGWEETFEAGIRPQNYIGDVFGTLGGVPDFGPGS